MTELEEIQRRIELKFQFLDLLEEEKGKTITEVRRLRKREKDLKDDQAKN